MLGAAGLARRDRRGRRCPRGRRSGLVAGRSLLRSLRGQAGRGRRGGRSRRLAVARRRPAARRRGSPAGPVARPGRRSARSSPSSVTVTCDPRVSRVASGTSCVLRGRRRTRSPVAARRTTCAPGAGARRRGVARRPAGRAGARDRASRTGRRTRAWPRCLRAAATREVVDRPGPVVAGRRARCGPRSATRSRTGRRGPAGAGAGAGRAATTPALDRGARRRLPHDRADPPAGGLRHQPDPRRRLPAGARPAGAGSAAAGCRSSAALGIVGFVLLARTEPSVVRAAAMGTVGAARPGHRRAAARAPGARRRGARRCCWSTRGWPVSVGFALSVLATAGILLLAPGLAGRPGPAGCRAGWPRRSRCRWPPSSPARRWSPRSRARSAWSRSSPTCWPRRPSARPRCSAWPAGSLGLVWTPLGRLARQRRPRWCVGWIVAVAERGADAAGAPRRLGDRRAGRWSRSPVAVRGAGALAAPAAAAATGRRPRLLRVLLVVAVLVRPPTPGLAAGRLGAGRLRRRPGRRAGARAGPGRRRGRRRRARPGADRPCLRRLGVRPGAARRAHPLPRRPRRRAGRRARRARGRRGRGDPLADPPAGWRRWSGLARRPGLRAGVAPYGVTRRVGDGHAAGAAGRLPGAGERGPGDGSAANDASVVLLVEVAGRADAADRRRRAAGAGARWSGRWPALEVDVLKVPHHGSAPPGPRLPAGAAAPGSRWSRSGPTTTTATRRRDARRRSLRPGREVRRTDLDGDLAVTVAEGALGVSVARRDWVCGALCRSRPAPPTSSVASPS